MKPPSQNHLNKKSNHCEQSGFANDVCLGLSAKKKYLLPIYFYDDYGSQIFEEICRLPEYYITRTEYNLLDQYANEIISMGYGNMSLIEFGSGSSRKTRILIEALLKRQGRLNYYPIDISSSIVKECRIKLEKEYSRLSVAPWICDFNQGVDRLSSNSLGQKLVLFLGSNIGNMDHDKSIDFLIQMAQALTVHDLFLIGIDMEKENAILDAAYNDSKGITAKFNRNLLQRINRELGGQFDLNTFDHMATYNKEKSRVEMHLKSQKKQDIFIGQLNRSFHFEEGETIHTENSHKYSLEMWDELLNRTNLKRVKFWQDKDGYFGLHLLQRK